jgi:hypothetical protein
MHMFHGGTRQLPAVAYSHSTTAYRFLAPSSIDRDPTAFGEGEVSAREAIRHIRLPHRAWTNNSNQRRIAFAVTSYSTP